MLQEQEAIAQLCVNLMNTSNYLGGKLFIFYFICALISEKISHHLRHKVYRVLFGNKRKIKLESDLKRDVKPYIVECLTGLLKSNNVSDAEKVC
jgi:hypothetical protein